MKINIFLVLTLSLMVSVLQAQPKKEEKKLWDKMFVGGNLGLQFGNVTSIEVSPHVGYYIMPRWSVGVGITYTYYNQAPYDYFYWTTPASGYYVHVKRFETNIYGYNFFTQLTLIRDMGRTIGVGNGVSLLAHAELDQISLENAFKVVDPSENGRFWLNSFFVGGGIRQAVGQRSSVYLLVLWDLNQTLNSLNYNPQNPTIKFGFDF